MKLPGITYQLGVQDLGREDINAPARQWAADQQVRDARSELFSTVAKVATDVEEYIGKDESNRAINLYNEQKQAWYQQQNYYDANGKPREDLAESFDEFDAKARETALKGVRTSTGQKLFAAQADRLNVEYKNQWGKQTISWYKEDQFANTVKAYENSVNMGDYGAAYAQIDDAQQRGLITPVKAEEFRMKTQTHQVERGTYNAIQSIQGIGDANKVRARIENTNQLSPERKEAYKRMLDNQMIDIAVAEARTALADVYEATSPQAASDLAVAIAQRARLFNSSAEDGVSDAARPAMINAIERVAADFIIKAEVDKQGTKTLQGIQCAANGTCRATTQDSPDRKNHDNLLKYRMGGQIDGSDFVEGTVPKTGQILENSAQGASYRAMMIDSFRDTGVVLPYVQQTLDAALTSNNPADVLTGVTMMKDMLNTNPGAATFSSMKIPNQYRDIIMAFDADEATNIILSNKNRNLVEKTFDEKAFEAFKMDDEGFSDYLKTHMPKVNKFFDDAPRFKPQFQYMVEEKAKELMPIVGNRPDAAYRAAVDSVSREYMTDQYTGTVVTKPFEFNVPYGNINKGEWVHTQLKNELREYTGQDISEYTYYPVENFDPNYPEYVISWIDPESGRYQATVFEPIFEGTPEEHEMRKSIQNKNNEINRVEGNAKLIEEVNSTHGNFEAMPWDARMQFISDKLQEDVTSGINWMLSPFESSTTPTDKPQRYEIGQGSVDAN